MTWECRDPTSLFFVDREVTWTGSKQGYRLACMWGAFDDPAGGGFGMTNLKHPWETRSLEMISDKFNYQR